MLANELQVIAIGVDTAENGTFKSVENKTLLRFSLDEPTSDRDGSSTP